MSDPEEKNADNAKPTAADESIGNGDDKSRPSALVGSSAAVEPNQAARPTYVDYSHVPPDPVDQSRGGKDPAQTFPMKLHSILSSPEFQDIIAWLPHGRAWRILQHKAFEERVIPLYFRHGRYSSFARQVNGWGFKRITHGPDYNAYYHEMFLRGLPHVCEKMKRLANKEEIKKNEKDASPPPDFYALSRDHPLPEGPTASGQPGNSGLPSMGTFQPGTRFPTMGRTDFVALEQQRNMLLQRMAGFMNPPQQQQQSSNPLAAFLQSNPANFMSSLHRDGAAGQQGLSTNQQSSTAYSGMANASSGLMGMQQTPGQYLSNLLPQNQRPASSVPAPAPQGQGVDMNALLRQLSAQSGAPSGQGFSNSSSFPVGANSSGPSVGLDVASLFRQQQQSMHQNGYNQDQTGGSSQERSSANSGNLGQFLHQPNNVLPTQQSSQPSSQDAQTTNLLQQLQQQLQNGSGADANKLMAALRGASAPAPH